MSTLILSKDELKTLRRLARERNVTLGEAIRFLIRKETEDAHKLGRQKSEVPERCN